MKRSTKRMITNLTGAIHLTADLVRDLYKRSHDGKLCSDAPDGFGLTSNACITCEHFQFCRSTMDIAEKIKAVHNHLREEE